MSISVLESLGISVWGMSVFQCIVQCTGMAVFVVSCIALFAFLFIKILGEDALRTFSITVLMVWMTTFAVYAMYID